MFGRGEKRSQNGVLLVMFSPVSRVDEIGVRSNGEQESLLRSMIESVEEDVRDLFRSM